MNKRVAVLLGGFSAEREVSMDSGRASALALRQAGYDVTEIEVGRDLSDLIAALKPRPDVVFNALHGRWGEDGCVQGLLELMNMRYTHSGIMASALAMNKDMAKRIVAMAGVTSPRGVVLSREELRAKEPIERPFVLKPVGEGSSVGVRIVREGDNEPLFGAGEWVSGEQVLVEEYIPGRELTVGVMGDQSLAVTEIVAKVGFYDYRAKYTKGHADHIVPADLPAEVTEAAMQASLAAHRALGCRGVTRSDFRYDDTASSPGKLFYLETNTQPGMTSMSTVPEQAAYRGISFPDLCAWIVENAACDA